MEWVRCNSCGYYPSSLTRFSVFLTSCGHLCCSKCLEGAPDTGRPGMVGCLKCGQPCKTVKLGPDSQPGPDVTFYFSDVESTVKKFLQVAQFQKTHYEVGAKMAKKKRLLMERKEGDRRGKELAELDEMLDKLTVPLAKVLEGVREKTRRAGIQLPLPQEPNHNRPNPTSCSPATAQHQQQLHSISCSLAAAQHHPISCSPAPTTAAAQHQQLHPSTPQLQTRPRQQGCSFSPVTTKPIQPINRSPAMQQQQQLRHINASPISTPLMSKCPTTTTTTTAAMPGSVDPRVTANLMAQSQLQNWSQSHAHIHTQRQLLRQSPAAIGVAMGVSQMMTPPQMAAEPRYSTSMLHNQHTTALGVYHGQQHNKHPLNFVYSMHTNAAGTATIATSAPNVSGRAHPTGRSVVIRTTAPGSVLSQATPI